MVVVVGEHLDKLRKNWVSSVPQNAGTLSAIIVASTFSACLTLGYAGEQVAHAPSIIHDSHGNIVAAHNSKASSSSGTSSSDTKIYYSSGNTRVTESASSKLSVSELRARAELKVGRDKRSLVMIQERLHRDETILKELQKEESQLEAMELGF